MRKIYSEKQRLDMVVEANLNNKLVEVFTDTISYPIYNEEGEIIGYKEEEVENIHLVDNPVGLSMLKMTPLDFLKALLQLGISYDTIKSIMEANPAVEMEMKYCQNVYRGHPMITQFAQQYGISDEVLDAIFIKANERKVEEVHEVVEPEPVEEETNVEGE